MAPHSSVKLKNRIRKKRLPLYLIKPFYIFNGFINNRVSFCGGALSQVVRPETLYAGAAAGSSSAPGRKHNTPTRVGTGLMELTVSFLPNEIYRRALCCQVLTPNLW